MTNELTPERWAFELTHLLNAAFSSDRFPVKVPELARDFSTQRFPDAAISRIIGDDLPGFEGALYPAPRGKKGWAIIYNDRVQSKGRVNFTLAHEFGHYLLHRDLHPEGIQCGEQDFVRWDSEYGQIEHQANVFASNLLMPLDDFRKQIDPAAKPNLDVISHCADRYGVSFIAASLRWLTYTRKRALLVVSRDEFILWSRASRRALKTGAFIRTSRGPVGVPDGSLAQNSQLSDSPRDGAYLPTGVWFDEPVFEMTLRSEQYDFVCSILLLEDLPDRSWDEEPMVDVFQRMQGSA